MKRLALCILLVLACGLSYADNSARIKELQDKSMELRQRLAQYQQIMANIQTEIIKIDGGIVELELQDKPKE